MKKIGKVQGQRGMQALTGKNNCYEISPWYESLLICKLTKVFKMKLKRFLPNPEIILVF